MGRRPRLCVVDGIYHVVARGNDGDPIYVDDHDRFRFVELAERVIKRCGWRCLTYCLMTTHYHLMVRTPLPNLSGGMHELNTQYAKHFNRRHGGAGHLFRERYHSTVIATDAHLLACARYVDRNPVVAGICRRPEQWRWSGHRALIGGGEQRLVAVDELLQHFGSPRSAARRRYFEFIHAPKAAAEDEHRRQQLGTRIDLPLPAQVVERPPLEDIISAEHVDLDVWVAHSEHGYSRSEIARFLRISDSSVGRRVRRMKSAGNEKTPLG
jgi:REP element-mobilizing transposase RayT